jgi:hypothetical protein
MNMNTYYDSEKSELLHPFKNSELIKRTYSQAYQDLFVLSVLNGKKNGTYVEIGSNHPTVANNTYVLETVLGWKGVSFDIDEEMCKEFKIQRRNPVVICDATTVDYSSVFEQYRLPTNPNRIDYLQVDIEPAPQTLAALKAINFDLYKFSVITFETDIYVGGGSARIVEESREYLRSYGYQLVAKHVMNGGNPFEDWYVDPSVVAEEKWKPFESQSVECVEMFIKGGISLCHI